MHWPPAVQVLPFAFLPFMQVPLPSHWRGCSSIETQALSIGSSSPTAMFEQVPRLPERLQALHAVVQALSQQTPSLQLPLAQSE